MKIEEILNETDKNFRKKLLINLENLETEISKIPVQLFDVSHLYALAVNEFKEAKNNLERTETHVYMNIKKTLDGAKIKASEKLVDAKVKSHSLYIKALDSYNIASSKLELLRVKKEAIELKSKMLEPALKALDTRLFLRKKLMNSTGGNDGV